MKTWQSNRRSFASETIGSSIDMDLLCTIRSDRARLRRRQPLERKPFNTVSCIVKAYGLGENFVRLLDQTDKLPCRENMEFNKIRVKKVLELPPSCLLSQHQYEIAVTIANKLDNPYLAFAHSPDELLLSAPLYESNPLLDSEHLSRYHFETLLLCQRAKEELVRLERKIGTLHGAVAEHSEVEEIRDNSSPWSSLQEHIKQLRAFIATIDNAGS